MTGRGERDWGGVLGGVGGHLNWEGERGLGWITGRGLWLLKNLNGKGGSYRFSIRQVEF
jgi:hypothetical protein